MIVRPFPSFFHLVLWPLLTSCRSLLLQVFFHLPTRPPRVSVITFTSYIRCIYALKFGQYWTLFCMGNSSVSSTPYIQFLFVRPRFCLRLSSDSASRRTPLSLANSSYFQACSGLSPPSYYACRAHQIKPEYASWILLVYSGFFCFYSNFSKYFLIFFIAFLYTFSIASGVRHSFIAISESFTFLGFSLKQSGQNAKYSETTNLSL